jgi:hypothetical protein
LRNVTVAYETFERRSVRVEEFALAIDPVGRIALNAASSRAFHEAGVKAVRILWDKEKSGIALQAARKGDMNAYSIAFGGGSRSSTITAKAFIRHIGWSSDRRQTVPAKWNAQQKMLEAQLPSNFLGTGGKKGMTRKEDTGS